jgi:hypothetical protein
MPGRRTPRQACDGLSFRRYLILQVFTHRLLISQLVILLQQTVEQRLLRCAAHRLELQGAQFS